MEKTERIAKIFETAMQEVMDILRKDLDEDDYDKIHDVKSWLYIMIERLGMKAESFLESQRLLRELLTILNLRASMKENERKEGLRIIGQLMRRGLPLRHIRLPKDSRMTGPVVFNL